MKKILTVFLFALILFISGCATNHHIDIYDKVGFFSGLRDGFTVLFAFIGSRFSDKYTLYDVGNNGFRYNFGYILGVGLFFGGSSGAVANRTHEE